MINEDTHQTNKLIIAVDNKGIRHTTELGNGRQYCKDKKVNLDWSEVTSIDGIILSGGIGFFCRECGASGAIMSSDFTLDLKHKVGVTPHGKIGIEFYTCLDHEAHT